MEEHLESIIFYIEKIISLEKLKNCKEKILKKDYALQQYNIYLEIECILNMYNKNLSVDDLFKDYIYLIRIYTYEDIPILKNKEQLILEKELSILDKISLNSKKIYDLIANKIVLCISTFLTIFFMFLLYPNVFVDEDFYQNYCLIYTFITLIELFVLKKIKDKELLFLYKAYKLLLSFYLLGFLILIGFISNPEEVQNIQILRNIKDVISYFLFFLMFLIEAFYSYKELNKRNKK